MVENQCGNAKKITKFYPLIRAPQRTRPLTLYSLALAGRSFKVSFVTTSRSFLRFLRLYQQIEKKSSSLKQPVKAEKKTT